MTAVVIEDEELARAHLCKMLQDLGVEVIGVGESGEEARHLVLDLKPNAVFLDIQMPGMTGMQAASDLKSSGIETAVVFVTGYSEHALEAFENAAVDYLIKPVSEDRLTETVTRIQRGLPSSPTTVPSPNEKELLLSRRLPVRIDYAVKLLKYDDIECIVSKEKRVLVRVKGTDYRAHYTLTQLEDILPAEEFMRVHLSAIVRVELIETVNFLGNHTYSLTLQGGLVIPIGRTYYAELQRRLGLL